MSEIIDRRMPVPISHESSTTQPLASIQKPLSGKLSSSVQQPSSLKQASTPATSEFSAFELGDDIGDEHWWRALQQKGTPLVEPLANDQARVTFVWRDPHGDEHRSPIRRVYIDVNSVTNHRSRNPQSLERIAGTDVWRWRTTLPANWRGTYTLAPVAKDYLPPNWSGSEERQRMSQRVWWRDVMSQAIADPLNPNQPYSASWGGAASALHLPQAPKQRAWRSLDAGESRPGDDSGALLQELHWSSQTLGNRRKVWIFSPEEAQGDNLDPRRRPLVILLDGQHWATRMPAFSALQYETRQGALPPAVYVLIDAIDGERRSEELCCNPRFWEAVQDELIPLAASVTPFSSRAMDTVVAGQSFGGLAAMYAGLAFSERFGCVLSQSGSFWWPYVEYLHAPLGQCAVRRPGERGALAEQLAQGRLSARPLRIYQEVGAREDVMIDLNETLRIELERAGHHVNYQLFEGGHDWLCWRGGLIEGLRWLLEQPG
ncbi:enterochelin esterase [Hahella sp. CR1]|uniref:enterochelin esterase n=1 Tax=Hahella sp. CR1 TaxID=2992807 RepID=UPI002441EE2A|nr:enterochelin esterase [Hahella sp. CR1]MDG9672157.1 enterochelin esterase [Hahella sp. CR1]